jgi:hypothetical protein
MAHPHSWNQVVIFFLQMRGDPSGAPPKCPTHYPLINQREGGMSVSLMWQHIIGQELSTEILLPSNIFIPP